MRKPLALFYPDPVVRAGCSRVSPAVGCQKQFPGMAPSHQRGKTTDGTVGEFSVPDWEPVINIGHDFSAQRMAEDALRESAQTLARSEETRPHWQLEVRGGGKPACLERRDPIASLSPHEFDATYEAFLAAVHPKTAPLRTRLLCIPAGRQRRL